MASKFRGIGVALVTPFLHDHSIDYPSLGKIIEHVESNVDYLVVCGTTGESATLTVEERVSLVKYVKDRSDLPIMFGYGSNNTRSLISGLDSYPWDLISGILSVSPYYNKPSQEGIIAHYEQFADAAPVPIILYNVPGRTSSDLLAETVVTLSQHANIIGVKDASGNMGKALQIVRDVDPEFLLISGDDLLTLPLISCGAMGVISVLANAYPEFFKIMFESTRSGDWDVAREQASKIMTLNDEMYAEGSPAGIKQLLSHMGLCSNIVRSPLTEVSDQLAGIIFEKWQKIKGNM